MDRHVFKAQKRGSNKSAKALRREGHLPAVLYGKHYPSTAIMLDAHSANLVIPHLSSSTIVEIDVDGEKQAALIREKQKDYLRNRLIHVDFQAVSMTEKIRAMVSIAFEGIAPAIKDFNAVIVHNITDIEVEATPRDLPERIEVDLSVLKEIGDAIHIKDLPISSGVTVLHDMEDVVAVATATREEEVEEPVSDEAAEPEVIERGRKEEEEAE